MTTSRSLALGAALLPAVPALLAAQEEHAAGGPLTVEWGLTFWTLVVFGLLLFVLYRFAWPGILGAVEAREQAILRQLADAERLQAEAKAALEEQRRLLAETRSGAAQLMADARAAAERERTLATERTKQEQDEMLARARQEIGQERERAIADLRKEAVDLSLAAASKLIGERLDGDADRRLVATYLSSLERRN